MNISILYLFLFLFIKNIFIFADSSNCLYYNPIVNQSYNLSSLKLTPELKYSATFPSTDLSSFSFDAYFNFCNGTVNACTVNGATACQNIGIFQLGSTKIGESVNYTSNGITIVYRSEIFTPITGNNCSGAPEPNRRKTSFLFSCNPNIPTLNVSAPGIEVERCTYEIKIDSSLVCRDCPLNCSQPHGICNRITGECQCDSQTKGKSCELLKIYINSVDSTTINGGTTYIHGYFGNTTSKTLKIIIGDLKCNNIQIYNESTIKCDIGPGEGIKDVLLIDNDLSFVGKQIFQYSKISLSCPNNCTSSSNGICNSDLGTCTCLKGFTGFNCNSKDNTDTDTPSSKPNINETTGEASISNDGSNYKISIYSLVELNFNGSVVNEFLLSNKWNKTNNDSNKINDKGNRIINFSQNISNSTCKIEYSIEEVIGVNKDYSFAGVNFTLSPGSIKLTVSIQNYTYQNTLNSIQLRIKSSLGDNINSINSNSTNCNSKKLNVNTNDFNNDQSLNYLTISKDSKTFYGRFINKVISDGRETFMSTSIVSQQTDSIFIGLNLPHCIKTCLIDPDFSLLVDTDYKTSCDDDDSRPKWFLPVVIAVPAVGMAIIIIIGAVIYKRHRIGIRILKQKIKLENRQ
ncbi:hypothetical protein RB653_003145 [Dictyostelium firmibasis]|uniref:EGF-like domain-containing protein n=1 Tax=Dictyostelium firmibasis TaxID=79012 RepID=A0AAN7TQ17_9MYCE